MHSLTSYSNYLFKSFLFLHFFRSSSPSTIVSSLLQKLKLFCFHWNAAKIWEMDVVSAYLLRFDITINPMKFFGAVSTLSQLVYFAAFQWKQKKGIFTLISHDV
jgi:hypothetical protein